MKGAEGGWARAAQKVGTAVKDSWSLSSYILRACERSLRQGKTRLGARLSFANSEVLNPTIKPGQDSSTHTVEVLYSWKSNSFEEKLEAAAHTEKPASRIAGGLHPYQLWLPHLREGKLTLLHTWWAVGSSLCSRGIYLAACSGTSKSDQDLAANLLFFTFES